MPTTVASYEGHVDMLGTDTTFHVTSHEEQDGSAVREMYLDHSPLLPSEFMSVLVEIAPVAGDNPRLAVTDMKADMAQVLDIDGTGFPRDKRMARIHRSAFGEHWGVMERQGQAVFDALPYRRTVYAHLYTGPKSLRDLIGSVANKDIKRSYFQLWQAGGEGLVDDVTVADDGMVILPGTPFIRLPDQEGNATYIKDASLRKDEQDNALQRLQGMTMDGQGTVLLDKADHNIPVWSTYHEPRKGIVPLVSWRRNVDGSLAPVHQDPATYQTEHAGETWEATSSTVAGSVALAALSPEVTSGWPRRRGFTERGKQGQIMGPLQAMLLSVMHGEELLRAPFVQHIESVLA